MPTSPTSTHKTNKARINKKRPAARRQTPLYKCFIFMDHLSERYLPPGGRLHVISILNLSYCTYLFFLQYNFDLSFVFILIKHFFKLFRRNTQRIRYIVIRHALFLKSGRYVLFRIFDTFLVTILSELTLEHLHRFFLIVIC